MRLVGCVDRVAPLPKPLAIGGGVKLVRHVGNLIGDPANHLKFLRLLRQKAEVVRHGVEFGNSPIDRGQQPLHKLDERGTRKTVMPGRFHGAEYMGRRLEPVQGYDSAPLVPRPPGAPMKPWMKIAIGCFALCVLAVFLFVAGVVGLGYWAKNKVEEVTGGGPEVEEARKAANAVPFTRPGDGVIDEARLVRFIEVRAAVHRIYEKYKGEIDSRMTRMKEGRTLDFSDLSTGLTLMGELQRAETLALARHQMSEDEYSFIAGEVYKSMWTDLGGAEASKQALREATRAAKAAADAMRRAEGLPPEAREAIAEATSAIAKDTDAASIEIENIATAPQNVALFKKYEADLKKYAMPGLRVLFDDASKAKDPKPKDPA